MRTWGMLARMELIMYVFGWLDLAWLDLTWLDLTRLVDYVDAWEEGGLEFRKRKEGRKEGF